MFAAQSRLFLVDNVAKTMATDAGSFFHLFAPASTEPHPPHFLSLLRCVGAGAWIASTLVESAIAMETKYVTMETRESLSRLCKNSCRANITLQSQSVSHLPATVIPSTFNSKHVKVRSVHAVIHCIKNFKTCFWFGRSQVKRVEIINKTNNPQVANYLTWSGI